MAGLHVTLVGQPVARVNRHRPEEPFIVVELMPLVSLHLDLAEAERLIEALSDALHQVWVPLAVAEEGR